MIGVVGGYYLSGRWQKQCNREHFRGDYGRLSSEYSCAKCSRLENYIPRYHQSPSSIDANQTSSALQKMRRTVEGRPAKPYNLETKTKCILYQCSEANVGRDGKWKARARAACACDCAEDHVRVTRLTSIGTWNSRFRQKVQSFAPSQVANPNPTLCQPTIMLFRKNEETGTLSSKSAIGSGSKAFGTIGQK